jgi:hypothetical protein
MAQEGSRQPFTADARVPSQVSRCGAMVGSLAMEEVFLQVLRVPCVTVIPPVSFFRHRQS